MNNKIIIGIIVIVVLAGIGGYYLLTQQNGEKTTRISLEEKKGEESMSNEEVIKIAVSAMISPKETLSVYGDILNYIGEKMGKKVELVQRKTYAEVNELVKNKEVIAAFVCSGPYVDGHKEFGMEAVVAPQMYGKTLYYSYIIVSADSPIKSFSDLKGKKFAFTDPKSNTGKLVPTYILAKMGETPDSYFGKYIFSGSHDNSIEAVAKKIVDGAAVDHLIYEYIKDKNPAFVAGTKVLEKYGPYGMPPFVTRSDLDPQIKEQLKTILLGMDKDPKGKELINKIMIEKFVEVKDSLYDSVREMREWEEAQLKK